MVDAWLAFVGVLAVLGAASAYTWWNDAGRRVRRALRRYPLVAPTDVRDGDVVRLVGTVRAGSERLVAPLSGHEAALFVTTVEEHDRGKGPWRLVAITDRGVDFLLDAGPGPPVYVKVVVPSADLPVVARDQSTAFRAPSPSALRYLASVGVSTEGILLRRRLLITERALVIGARVAVAGVARWEPDPEPEAAARDYRTRAMRLRLEAPLDGDMFLSTDPATMR
jgi:hypothetical protein